MTPGFRPVNATPPPDAETDRHDATPGTLGALLYADKRRSRVPEEEWVGLVHGIAAGDQRALYALYQRAHRASFTLIMRITNSRETAEELTVDVFHGVWQRAAQYDAASGSVLGWILIQARSRAIDRLRFENRKKRVDPRADGSTAEPEMHAHEILELKQQRRQLRDALTILTPDERVAIETAFFAELTYPEVAARLNQPLGTIKTRIRSGLGKLRQALASSAVRS
jgi:RNA polymerase sigma-70 factor, ECF subfamily